MKIYIAGPYVSSLMPSCVVNSEVFRYKLAKKWIAKDIPVLESFHYIGKTDTYVNLIRKDKKKIFLDSGAFSMFTQGINIDLRNYADFIKRNRDIIKVASNLDAIGAGNEQKTWDNQRALEDMGVKIQPVHHARDKDEWLIKYIEAGYKYIFLGGMVPESTSYLKKWLDRIWDTILTDKKGKPIVKVHGFGLTKPNLINRYPWYSVDSTSWLISAASGDIHVPINGSLKIIPYSDRSADRRKRGAHYSTLTPPEQKIVAKWIKKIGFKEKNLHDRRYGRATWNILMFRYIQDNTKWPKKFKNTHRGFFDGEGNSFY